MDENETRKPARRRRRAPRAAKPPVAEALAASASAQPPEGDAPNTVPESQPAAGSPAAEPVKGEAVADATDGRPTAADTDDPEAPKRRRRGRRGGRRHRRRREAAEAGAPGTSDDDAAPRPAALDALSGTLAPAPEAGATTASEAAVKPQPASSPAPEATPAPETVPVPSVPRSSKRGSRRRRKSVPAEVAEAVAEVGQTRVAGDRPVVAQGAAVDETPPVGEGMTTEAPALSAASGDAGVSAPRTRRPRRRRKASGSAAAAEPIAADDTIEAVVGSAPDAVPAEAESTVAGETHVAKPRRRSRGRRRASGPGRDEGSTASDDGVASDKTGRREKGEKGEKTGKGEKVGKGEKPDGAEKREKTEKRPARGRRRERQPSGVLPDLPGRKEILVTADAGELRVALVEDGRLAEIYIERPGKRSFAGNMYMGKVDNVLPGIDAAFVDVGLGRNGFLAVDDIDDPEDGSKRPKRISQMLKPKQPVLVQVSKDPMGSKGARLTGQLSLAGRYLVYVPRGSGVGVSRRLPDEERDRLREICKSLKAKDAGLIVRTVAEGKDVDELRRDLKYLSALWTRVKAKAEKVTAPAIVYEEDDVALQVARDLFNDSFAAVLVDDAKRHEKLVSYLKKTAPELADRVKLYDDAEPLFRAHGIEEQIANALERRVLLPSGGNLVIDHTEALTVIDVNSGRFTSGKGLEDTITHTNLEAAREVVRQLRLRDIGGIIIIDFIDMEHPKNREAVLAKLQAELDTDRTKTYVVEISPLGLVEMTRQNITDGARGILTQACPYCEGKARVLSHETMAMTVERRLRRHLSETAAKAMLIEVNAGVAERLQKTGRVKGLERETKRRFFFEGSRSLPVDTYRILAEGTLAAVEAHRIPLAEEQEVVVELDYGLTYSPSDAVASVDGYQVVVLNGRRYLGEKRKVRVTTVSRAGAVAVLSSQT